MACYARWTQWVGGLQKETACGQCIGCRLEYSRQWAIRCLHEAQLHKHNAYVTLTYNDKHLPPDGSLVHRDFQLFMKRLRKAADMGARPHTPIRYYMSGEYGEKDRRPHYHALLFGAQFTDQVYHHTTASGQKLYTSTQLEQLWPLGYSTVGAVTFQSAAYVARYVMKKATTEHQKITELELEPEYSQMSRRNGIGENWIKKYKTDVYPHGLVVINGREIRPPKYYDKYYKKTNPIKHRKMINERQQQALEQMGDNSNERLDAKETVKRAQLNQLKRKL